MPPDRLSDLIKSYEAEAYALKEQITDICLHMNGGVEYSTAWGMSFEDREIAIKRINKRNLEKNPGGKEYM